MKSSIFLLFAAFRHHHEKEPIYYYYIVPLSYTTVYNLNKIDRGCEPVACPLASLYPILYVGLPSGCSVRQSSNPLTLKLNAVGGRFFDTKTNQIHRIFIVLTFSCSTTFSYYLYLSSIETTFTIYITHRRYCTMDQVRHTLNE